MDSLNALKDRDKYQVYGECLACLAYFAVATKQVSHTVMTESLAKVSRLSDTPDLKKRISWWTSKLSNMHWAFRANGLSGTTLHGRALPELNGRGLSGQPATQERIKAYALATFTTDLPRCIVYAKRYIAEGSTLSAEVHSALFDIKSTSLRPTTLSARDAASVPEEDGAAYEPNDRDERDIVNRQIRARRGQRSFRDSLRTRYGDRCLVTGCDLLALLEAAHISPYRGAKDNAPDNGLLLRADIHTLYDLDLIAIDPGTLRICVHPALPLEYRSLAGRSLGVKGENGPSESALHTRFVRFKHRCNDPVDE
jgi:hypothetical protein